MASFKRFYLVSGCLLAFCAFIAYSYIEWPGEYYQSKGQLIKVELSGIDDALYKTHTLASANDTIFLPKKYNFRSGYTGFLGGVRSSEVGPFYDSLVHPNGPEIWAPRVKTNEKLYIFLHKALPKENSEQFGYKFSSNLIYLELENLPNTEKLLVKFSDFTPLNQNIELKEKVIPILSPYL